MHIRRLDGDARGAGSDGLDIRSKVYREVFVEEEMVGVPVPARIQVGLVHERGRLGLIEDDLLLGQAVVSPALVAMAGLSENILPDPGPVDEGGELLRRTSDGDVADETQAIPSQRQVVTLGLIRPWSRRSSCNKADE